jgi:phosphopantetheinyl transferase (holo-ACP synthase)
VEVVRRPGGPPRLGLSTRAQSRLHDLGADRTLVSLTHGREQAAASVLLLRGGA